MAKKRPPAWARRSALERQLGLMRWLGRIGRWVPTAQIAGATYGTGLSERRQLHRDLRTLQRVGIPVESDGSGSWRVRRPALLKWMRTLE